jgi:hypothetical protein
MVSTPRVIVVVAIIGAVGAALGSGRARAADAGVTLAAAGDIACPPTYATTPTQCHHAATAALIGHLAPTAVAALGDNQYAHGGLPDYMASFEATWGSFKSLIRPVPGNHEYQTPGAAGYYAYFGQRAGDPSTGFYSYDLGAWHVLALNSNCEFVACGAGSPQERWVRADLAAHPGVCTLAYWHHPVFGSSGGSDRMRPIWATLSALKVDVVLNGHNHSYERFAAQDYRERPDVLHGIREFVVGTGGADLGLGGLVAPNSEARDSSSFGVLLLHLRPGAYDWRFYSENTTFSDAGDDICHDKTSPVLRALSLGARAFRPARHGGSLSADRPDGARLTYRLSEPAGVTFALERAIPVRPRGGTCAPRPVASRHAPDTRARRCRRWVTLRVRAFTWRSSAGRTRLRFSGRVRGRRLRPGHYRLVAVATDAAQNTSAPLRVAFDILR